MTFTFGAVSFAFSGSSPAHLQVKLAQAAVKGLSFKPPFWNKAGTNYHFLWCVKGYLQDRVELEKVKLQLGDITLNAFVTLHPDIKDFSSSTP